MKILKSYKFRLYPNSNQRLLINKTLGCSRFIYNYFLNQKQKSYEEMKTSKSAYECCKELKELSIDKVWLKEVDSCALRIAIFDLDDAYTRFYKDQGKYPNFKGKYHKSSYRTNNMVSEYKNKVYNSIEVNFENKEIKLPKLKTMKIRGYRNIKEVSGRVINATISRDKSNRYYVSVLMEVEEEKIENTSSSIIGIDLGIKSLLVTSSNEVYRNPKVIEKYEKRVKHLQRELSKKVRGSRNYQKCREKIATIYRKIRNSRRYHIHKITKRITDNNKVIVMEKLRIKDMLENHNLSKLISDASWNEIVRQMEYKSKWKNVEFYQVESNYASSQLCNRCGYKNVSVKDLSKREYECDKCGTHHDRDLNAAINLMERGIKYYIERYV